MKTDLVRELVKEGKMEEALKIAKTFKREFGISKEDLKQIQIGGDCLAHSDFYKQIGKNPEAEIKMTYAVLKRVYGGNK